MFQGIELIILILRYYPEGIEQTLERSSIYLTELSLQNSLHWSLALEFVDDSEATQVLPSFFLYISLWQTASRPLKASSSPLNPPSWGIIASRKTSLLFEVWAGSQSWSWGCQSHSSRTFSHFTHPLSPALATSVISGAQWPWPHHSMSWLYSPSKFRSVAQLCPTLCNPMDCSTPGSLVHHQLPEFAQTHVHRVGDAISHLILCCPLLLPPSIFPSIRVFSNELVLHITGSKFWSFSFSISPSNEYSGLISFRIDWFGLLAVQGTLKSLLQHHSLLHHSTRANTIGHNPSFMSLSAWYLALATGK